MSQKEVTIVTEGFCFVCVKVCVYVELSLKLIQE